MRDHIQARNMSDTFVIRYCLFLLREVFNSIVLEPELIDEVEKMTHSKPIPCHQPQYCSFKTENQFISPHYILDTFVLLMGYLQVSFWVIGVTLLSVNDQNKKSFNYVVAFINRDKIFLVGKCKLLASCKPFHVILFIYLQGL